MPIYSSKKVGFITGIIILLLPIIGTIINSNSFLISFFLILIYVGVLDYVATFMERFVRDRDYTNSDIPKGGLLDTVINHTLRPEDECTHVSDYEVRSLLIKSVGRKPFDFFNGLVLMTAALLFCGALVVHNIVQLAWFLILPHRSYRESMVYEFYSCAQWFQDLQKYKTSLS